MKVLVIGGTGLISTAAVQRLLDDGVDVGLFNRGQTPQRLSGTVQHYVGDRDDVDALRRTVVEFAPDAVLDAICFRPEQAQAVASVLRGRDLHLVFISTVCVFGGPLATVPAGEDCPQHPVSPYGQNKSACEALLGQASADGQFALTIARPSYTYGPGGPLNGGLIGRDWSLVPRLRQGLPIIVADDGATLWHPGHVDDVGGALAAMCGSAVCFGKAYNTVGPQSYSHADYLTVTAKAIGCEPNLIHIPSAWLTNHADDLSFYCQLYRWDGAFSFEALTTDLPHCRPVVGLAEGVRRTVAWLDQSAQQRPPADDDLQQRLVRRWQNATPSR